MRNSLRQSFNIKNWSIFEILWIILFLSAGTIVTVFTKDSLLNYLILLTGILCVVFAAKGNIWNYAFGLINSLGYAYVSFINGLYGDMGLNLLFYFPTNIIGFFMWQKHLTQDSVEMRGLRVIQKIYVLLICAVSIGILGFALSHIKTQNTPYIDATSTILSIAATILMMWRYKEQWILYIVLNTVTILMWAIRLRNGSSDGTLMILMWTAFLVNAVYGYWIWRKGSNLKSKAESVS